ncbi:MAG TPA: palindromic element RPE2 domain-containing protein [Rickettsia endosymbiont of Sericostoma sp.]|nr:palindromic element RPE2 domain-containing protein [Rickettsia endosymbiont of Sericostoma sp.]
MKFIVNSGEFGARSDGATPINNRRATSDNVPNFSSIDYSNIWQMIAITRINIFHDFFKIFDIL